MGGRIFLAAAGATCFRDQAFLLLLGLVPFDVQYF